MFKCDSLFLNCGIIATAPECLVDRLTLRHMARLLWVLLVIVSLPGFAGQYHYSYTGQCRAAYHSYLALHTDEGDAALKKELIADPDNLMATYIADYHDCLTLLFNGDPVDYQQLKHHQDMRLALLAKGDEQSPWYRLCKAGIYMHWAFVHLRFDENLKAAANFRRSFLLLKENRRLFPSFEYNNVFLGIEEATVGALPDSYKWIASIFGMQGNIHSGIAKVRKFISAHKPGDMLYDEALVYYTYLCYYVGSDKEEAWKTVSSEHFNNSGHLLLSFVKANIAVNYRKASVATAVLVDISQNTDYKKYPIFEYEYGYALLYRLDSNAIARFRSFLSRYRGRIFVKDALQKIALLYYVNDNQKEAGIYKSKIPNEGSTITDSDKQAMRFAQQQVWPDKSLLRAQLLTEGGYYKLAQKLLSEVDDRDLADPARKLEYYFRLARVYDELDDHENAIRFYNNAIQLGRNRREQFAARSSLQLGFLFEEAKQYAKAKAMYLDALSMDDHDFQNSIDQQAKAGVKRISERK